jgi:hypothetical protein|tara:strand:- start:12816 stop:13385 length:570 start_codon:yes stop_codon:yes gene_type:complete
MSELSATFQGLSDAFDTEYEDDVEEKQVTVPDNKPAPAKKEDTPPATNGGVELQQVDFITDMIKDQLDSTQTIVERLDSDIKIGSKASMYEVYAQLQNSMTAKLTEMRKLHESAAKIQVDQNKKNLTEIGSSDKIQLTSEQLIDMVNAASEKSEINKIEADFKIDKSSILNDGEDDDDDEEDVIDESED